MSHITSLPVQVENKEGNLIDMGNAAVIEIDGKRFLVSAKHLMDGSTPNDVICLKLVGNEQIRCPILGISQRSDVMIARLPKHADIDTNIDFDLHPYIPMIGTGDHCVSVAYGMKRYIDNAGRCFVSQSQFNPSVKLHGHVHKTSESHGIVEMAQRHACWIGSSGTMVYLVANFHPRWPMPMNHEYPIGVVIAFHDYPIDKQHIAILTSITEVLDAYRKISPPPSVRLCVEDLRLDFARGSLQCFIQRNNKVMSLVHLGHYSSSSFFNCGNTYSQVDSLYTPVIQQLQLFLVKIQLDTNKIPTDKIFDLDGIVLMRIRPEHGIPIYSEISDQTEDSGFQTEDRRGNPIPIKQIVDERDDVRCHIYKVDDANLAQEYPMTPIIRFDHYTATTQETEYRKVLMGFYLGPTAGPSHLVMDAPYFVKKLLPHFQNAD